MKYLVFLFSITFVNVMFSQAYTPFNKDCPKRFMNPVDPLDNDYFFYSTHTSISGDTTIFNQYLRESSQTIDVTGTECEGWGGWIQPTADTTWIGRQFSFNSLTKELIINNSQGEELTFNFNLNIGDSLGFYTDNNSEYYIRYDNNTQELVIDSIDLVKTFSIWQYDIGGALIPSPLNGFEIKLSENYGLISFIDCHSFPTITKGLTLMGQLNPSIGYYQLTFDEVFPWNPGDTLELEGEHYITNWGISTINKDLITILDRVETSDSVWIYLNIESQIDKIPNGAPSHPGAYNIQYPNPIVFKKGANISAFPNKTIHQSTTHLYDSVNNCGTRGRLNIYEDFNDYCDSCDCFTPFDGDLSGITKVEYQEGLGMVYSTSQAYGNFDIYKAAELIYSNIGGVQCGSYIPLAIKQHKLNHQKELIKVVDLLGRETKIKPNTILIYMYNDGSSEKMFRNE